MHHLGLRQSHPRNPITTRDLTRSGNRTLTPNPNPQRRHAVKTIHPPLL
jgi:hypothetical protein